MVLLLNIMLSFNPKSYMELCALQEKDAASNKSRSYRVI